MTDKFLGIKRFMPAGALEINAMLVEMDCLLCTSKSSVRLKMQSRACMHGLWIILLRAETSDVLIKSLENVMVSTEHYGLQH